MMPTLPRPYTQIEGEVQPLPAYLRSGLDQTVSKAMGKATSALDVAEEIATKRRTEGVTAAARIEANIGRTDKLMERLEDRKPDVERPTYEPEPFKAPEAKYDPMEAFGSLASVIGVIGSLAARRPLTAALTASAAAMNAYKQADLETYKRSFEEWKVNSDLAAKKAAFDHDIYRDSINLMKTDMNAAQAQMTGIAAQNDDIKMMAALRSGDPQVWTQLASAREKIATDMPKLNDEILKRGMMAEANLEFYAENGQWPDASQEIELVKKVEDAFIKSRYGGGSVTQLRMAAIADWENTEIAKAQTELTGPDLEARLAEVKTEAIRQRRQYSVGAATQTGTVGFLKSEAIKTSIKEAMVKKGDDLTAKETTKLIQDVTKGGITGNLRDKLAGVDGMITQSLDKIDRSIAIIDRHLGSVGVPGYVRRAGETIKNLVGAGDETDLAQLGRDLKFLQGMAPQINRGTTGIRVLKFSAELIAESIGGFNMGDTSANVRRSLEEAKREYLVMLRNVDQRIQGTWEPTSEQIKEGPSGKSPTPWESDPTISGGR